MRQLLLLTALMAIALCATLPEWKNKAIYQLLTDRFYRTDHSHTAQCDTRKNVYCGGTYKGMVD